LRSDRVMLFIELDDRLGQIEINRASSHTLAVQNQRQIAHQFEARNQFGIALARAGIAFEDGVHVSVGHTLGRANDALA
jgi:hypothetical protein